MNEQELEALAARVTALESALGAMTMLALRTATPEQKMQFAEGLAQMASAAERAGSEPEALLLTEVHRALATGMVRPK